MSESKPIKNGLFLFHRDLRLQDNVGFLEACKICDHLYTVFIFTTEQVGPRNDYKSNNAIQFMVESLEELSNTIEKNGGKLMIMYEKNNENALFKIIDAIENITDVFFNRDYTPYAIKRDENVSKICEKKNIKVHTFSDYYLWEPGTVYTNPKKKDVYKKFTPFYDAVLHIPVEKPKTIRTFPSLGKSKVNVGDVSLEYVCKKMGLDENQNILVHGGRTQGLQHLKRALQTQKDYGEKRDYFTYETTFLSAYLKFGCISVREMFHAVKQKFGLDNELLRQLVWRDFFAHILFKYQNDVLEKSWSPHYRQIPWSKNVSAFQKWCKGETGFPIVDACMRQLNTTGYMHNRGRMLVAHFLVKILMIDWRWGEKYFARNLTDYDIASNNGNWQAIVGGGVYSSPYFRVMNPWIQSKTYDPSAEFIKKWVPELNQLSPREIHHWNDFAKKTEIDYPKPMTDYNEQKEKVLALYKKYI